MCGEQKSLLLLLRQGPSCPLKIHTIFLLLFGLLWCWFVFRETEGKSEGRRHRGRGRKISSYRVYVQQNFSSSCQGSLVRSPCESTFPHTAVKGEDISLDFRLSYFQYVPHVQAHVLYTEQPSVRSRQTRRSSRLHKNPCMRLWRNEHSPETSTVARFTGH